MSTPNSEIQINEARIFASTEEAVTFLQSIPQPESIIIITPPPK